MVDISTPILNSAMPNIINIVAIIIPKNAHTLKGKKTKYKTSIIAKNGTTEIADSLTLDIRSLKYPFIKSTLFCFFHYDYITIKICLKQILPIFRAITSKKNTHRISMSIFLIINLTNLRLCLQRSSLDSRMPR